MKLKEGATCAFCKYRGEAEGEYFICEKKGRVKPSDICRKYQFDPFAKRVKRQRHLDTSMFDPLDFEL